MKKQNIVSMHYIEHSIFCHPKTIEEFENVREKLMQAFENKDFQLMLIAACQLIPDKFITEE